MLPDEDSEPTHAVSGTRLTSAGLRRFATVLYALLAAAALVWTRLRTGAWWPEPLFGGDAGRSLAYGAGTALLTVALTAVLLRKTRATAWFARQVRELIGTPDHATCLHLALLSGFGEELFFRGAMQPALGYVLASVLFGLLHTGPDRRFLVWTAFALVLGFVLGGIVELTGSLAGPILAHVAINYLNLRQMARLDLSGTGYLPIGTPRADDPASCSAQNVTDSAESGGGEA